MSELQQYKCPCCGGAIAFDSSSQKLKCPYCETEFTLEELENPDQKAEKPAEEPEWTENMHSFLCKSCGGEILTDENTVATSCPFCGNPVVVTGRVSGFLKPDLIIPFKLDKKAAKKELARYISSKKLLPKVFKDENHLDEIKGIYVPFWLFDAHTDAQIHYHGTRVRMWSDSDYDYTETQHYKIYREGNVSFEHVPVDGSKKMPDDLMESVEPFDFSETVDFKKAYLAGYFADKYDVTAEESISRADERIKKSTEDVFRSTLYGYNTVVTENSQVNFYGRKKQYALYPVWILNTSWNGQKYTFAMNGQTGKFVGNLPVDKGAAVGWFTGVAAIASIVTYGIINILHLLGIL